MKRKENELKISFFVLTNNELNEEIVKKYQESFYGFLAVYDRLKSDKGYAYCISPETHQNCYLQTLEGQTYLHFGNARKEGERELLERYPDTDYIIWLDSDDDWERFLKDYNAEKTTLFKLLKEQKPDIVYCPYSYLKDNKGLTVYYPRVYNPYGATWTDDPVHETIDHANPNPKGEVYTALRVYHLREDAKGSVKRNFAILRTALADPRFNKQDDGRLWYLLAREAATYDIDFAIETAVITLGTQLAPHYKEATLALLSDLYWINGDLDNSEKYTDNLLEINPNSMLGLTNKARALMARGDYKGAAEKSFLALTLLKNSKLVLENMLGVQGLDPIDTQRLAYTTLLSALHELKDEVGVRNTIKEIEGLMLQVDDESDDLNKAIKVIKLYWDRKNKLDKTGICEGFPNSDYAVEFLRKNKLYKKWPDKSVVIYAPRNSYQWDGESVVKKGAGGSETAVVEISERLVKHGYDVTVFGNPEYSCEYNGVKYYHHTEINLADEFDTLVIFREEAVLGEVNPVANRKYLWLQDVCKIIYYTPEYLNRLDKILILSKYHRNTIKHVPEDKIYYTTNGINVGLIEGVEKELGDYKRDYKKFIYASSPDRGLETLLNMWEELQSQGIITDEKLYWYYGWNSFGTIEGSERWKWMQMMKEKMKKLGVIEGGRIGKKELYKEMLTANHLLYPYQRPAETSCIVAMEAQATGLIPLTTGLDALEETQQYGLKESDLESYLKTLAHIITAYKNYKEEPQIMSEYRQEMANWARKRYNWDTVVNDWLRLLSSN